MSVDKSGAEMAAEMEAELNGDGTKDMRSMLKRDEAAEGDMKVEGDDETKVEAKTDEVKNDDTTSGKDADAGKADAKPAAELATGAKEEDAPIQGAKGGVIPYQVLKDTRARVHSLESELADTKLKLAESLTSREQKKVDANTKAGADPFEGMDVESKDPELVALLRKQHAALESTRSELDSVKAKVEKVDDVRVDATAEAVQASIDAHPELAEWQAKDGVVWKAAVAIDAQLKDMPAWKDKPMAERFARVAELTAEAHGLPAPKGKAAPEKTDTQAANGGKDKPAKDVKAEKKPNVTSISDLSGGGQQTLDDREAMENSSARDIYTQMNGLSNAELMRTLRETG